MTQLPGQWRTTALALWAAAACACDGVVGAPTAPLGEGPPSLDAADEYAPGADIGLLEEAQTGLERLTRQQFQNTFTAAFDEIAPGIEVPEVNLPSDVDGAIFTTNGAARLADFSPYVDATRVLGAAAAAALIDTCNWAGNPGACIEDRLVPVMRVGYRRPVTPSDVTPLVSLAQDRLADDVGEEDALSLVLARLLLSPYFIFRMEHGVATSVDGSGRLLSGYELAARLAYLFTDAPPDAELSQLAQDGALTSASVRAAQAQRLLSSPAGQDMVWRFVERWLDLDRIYGQVSEPLRTAMLGETQRFVREVFGPQGDFQDLLTGRFTYVNDAVAELYQLPGGYGSDYQRIDLTDVPGRGGILTQPGMLAALTLGDPDRDVIPRGKMVLTRLLCQAMATPDASVINEPVEDRTRDSRCSGCHRYMDSIGTGFGAYDGLGRYDPAATPQGSLVVTELQGDFDSVPELSQRIAESSLFRRCMGKMMFHFGLGREPARQDMPSLEAMQDALLRSGSFHDMVVALVASDAFATRYDPPESASCVP